MFHVRCLPPVQRCTDKPCVLVGGPVAKHRLGRRMRARRCFDGGDLCEPDFLTGEPKSLAFPRGSKHGPTRCLVRVPCWLLVLGRKDELVLVLDAAPHPFDDEDSQAIAGAPRNVEQPACAAVAHQVKQPACAAVAPS